MLALDQLLKRLFKMTSLPFLFRRRNQYFNNKTTACEQNTRISNNNDESVYKWCTLYICGAYCGPVMIRSIIDGCSPLNN